MPHPYRLADDGDVFTPALVFYPELIRANIARVVEMAGGAGPAPPARQDAQDPRDRPHAARRRRHQAQVRHHRRGRDARRPPARRTCSSPTRWSARTSAGSRPWSASSRGTAFSVLDRPPGRGRGAALRRDDEAGRDGRRVLLDLDVGQHRTGIAVGDAAAVAVRARGDAARPARRTACSSTTGTTTSRAAPTARRRCGELLDPGAGPARRAGGEGAAGAAAGVPAARRAFPVYAALTDMPGLECSPGTFVLHDHGYGSRVSPTWRASRRPRCWSRGWSAGRRRPA